MGSFSQKVSRKANKPHKCEFCKKEIPKGEIYARVFVVDDGVYSYSMHEFCDTIALEEAREAGNEDCTLDFLYDCAYQKVFDEKDHESSAQFYGVTPEQINFIFGV